MKSPNFGRNQAGEGSSFLVEGTLGLAIGAALVGAVVLAWHYLFGNKAEPAYYPLAADLGAATKFSQDPFKVGVIGQIITALGYVPDKIDASKIPSRPIESESELRTILDALGIKPPNDLGARVASLLKEEAERKRLAGTSDSGVLKSLKALDGKVEALVGRGANAVVRAIGPSAEENLKAIEVAVSSVLAKREEEKKSAAKPTAKKPTAKARITHAKQKAAVRAKIAKVAGMPAPAPAGKP